MSETLEPETLEETATAPDLPESQEPQALEADAPEEEGEQELAVSFGDETPPPEPEDDLTWGTNPMRAQRQRIRDLERQKQELEEKLRAKEAPPPEIPLGAKPKLEDHDYDADKFELALQDWFEKKRVADEKAAQAQAEARANEEAWQSRLAEYGQAKAKLKVPDFEEAEERIQNLLPVPQQSAIVHVARADNPALIVYALSKHPAKAKELADISKLANGKPDVVKFAYELGKLVTQMKTTTKTRPAPPAPETLMKSTAPARSAVNATLERLRDEADRTGDRTKVAAYMRQLKAQPRK